MSYYDEDVIEAEPHSLGWLRRPELDSRKGEAWEKPDGEILFAMPGRKFTIQIVHKTPSVFWKTFWWAFIISVIVAAAL